MFLLYVGEPIKMIISLLNQKGGVGKSSLARALAVEFARNKWAVHVADLDGKQQTSFLWAERRKESGVEPSIDVSLYSEPKTALKAVNNADVLIVDGKAFADTHALPIAQKSDLIIIPVGISVDDLEPSLKLAVEFVNKGIDRASIVFVVCRVPDKGDKEAMNTRASIEAWNFSVVCGWIPMKSAYSQAMDKGLSFTETPFKSLSDKTNKIIEQLFNKATEQQTAKQGSA
ncbi:chromosome partitioning protein [Bathymodiolus japonicus methanotrophic gill symbiont]|nr:chromosome partitioning protein [Bathymodiolus japonicus methanotrophic gill symbiont]